MRQVLFVQGGGEGVHDAWDNRLVDSLGGELGPETPRGVGVAVGRGREHW